MEPYLIFIHLDMICLIYVHDCLFFARDKAKTNNMINDLKHHFVLELKEDVTAFLGIEVHKQKKGKLELIQQHLITHVIEIVFGTYACDMKTPLPQVGPCTPM